MPVTIYQTLVTSFWNFNLASVVSLPCTVGSSGSCQHLVFKKSNLSKKLKSNSL